MNAGKNVEIRQFLMGSDNFGILVHDVYGLIQCHFCSLFKKCWFLFRVKNQQKVTASCSGVSRLPKDRTGPITA